MPGRKSKLVYASIVVWGAGGTDAKGVRDGREPDTIS